MTNFGFRPDDCGMQLILNELVAEESKTISFT